MARSTEYREFVSAGGLADGGFRRQERPDGGTLPPVVLLGGEANALSVARSLRRLGAAVYLIADPGSCARYSRHCRPLDVPAEGGAEESWAEFLLGPQSVHLAGAVVLACDDAGVRLLARNRAALLARYRLDESDPAAQLAMLDKLATYRHAAAAGVPTPRFWHLPPGGRGEGAAGARERVLALRDELVFPLVVKPRLAHVAARGFKRKHVVVDDLDALVAALDADAAAGVDVLLMEHVPGPDEHLCSYYTYLDDDGTPLFDFTKRVVRRYPRGMGLGCYHVTDRVPEIVAPARALFRHAGLRGLANVEFKRDPRDGVCKLIECNARFTAANCLVAAAGMDLAAFVYRRIVGLPQQPLRSFRTGVRLWDPLVDAMAFIESAGAGGLTFRAWAGSVLRPQTFAYFRWTDPLPAAARLRKMFKLLASRRRKADVARPVAGPRADAGAILPAALPEGA